MHHINGNPSDNRIENLQILCPNCHAQTNNFRGKNSSISHGKMHTPASELELTEEQVEQRRKEKIISRRKNPEISKRPRKEEIVCLQCGKLFLPNERTSKYCSQECYRQAQSLASSRPDIFALINAFKEYKNFTQVAKVYNVTDNAVRK